MDTDRIFITHGTSSLAIKHQQIKGPFFSIIFNSIVTLEVSVP